MTTADAARDLDLLRQAVGDKQLTYVGLSYGAYLGATYANLFPGKVRALVLDGVPDPVAWATGRGNQARTQPLFNRLRSAQGAYATLLEFFRLCDRGGSNCAYSHGDPRRRYATLAKRLLANPAQTPDGSVTYANLVFRTFNAMDDPAEWPGLAETLQQLDSLTRPQVGAAAALPARPTRLAASQQRYRNILEGFPGVACSDSDNPNHVRAWERAADVSDRTAPYFGRYWTWLSSICQPWPGRDSDRYTGPWTKRTANPVLIVGNRFDPASPYQGAVTLARLLSRSLLLSLDGWGHTSDGKSSCIDAHTSRYLLTTRVPPRGTVCQPDIVPFAQPAAAQMANGPPERARSFTMRRGSPTLLVGALMAAVVLAVAAVLWSRDRATSPAASVPTPRGTRPPPDPASRQLLVGRGGGGRCAWRGRAGPVHASDRFRVGTLTKSLVATVVLRLVGEAGWGWTTAGSGDCPAPRAASTEP